MYAIHPNLASAIVEDRQRELRRASAQWRRKPISARQRVRKRR